MGYLTDNLNFQSVGECPALYPFEMIVEYVLLDPFTAPPAQYQLGQTIKDVLDVEDWQYSVLRPGRVKFRFHQESHRDQASAALSNVDPGVRVKQVAFQNPPDRATRGIA